MFYKVQRMNFDDYEKTYVSTYTKFADVVRFLLKDAITKTEGLPRLQSTKARGKEVTSLKLKLEERGLLASEHIESEIKDLAGVRLIFYTNTDVDRFLRSELIPNTFVVDWKETRIHHPTDDNNQQRYQAIHYTVLLSEKYTALSKYKRFKDMRCEIQIQTILNHAWAETYHDMVYKARSTQGFGTRARQALDKRMKKVMDDYLLPAGYEFQKVQHDYERLMQGKALFDQGVLETLESCDNNNERHEILSTIAEYVIPYYDDIRDMYPEVRRALETAVQAARNTKTKPIEIAFGNLSGKTSQDVAIAAIGILDILRYVDFEATFRSLIDMYKGEQDTKVRKQIVDAIRHIANYDLDVWKRVGPSVQRVVADMIEGFSQDDFHLLRQIVLTVWHELLRSEMDSTSTSADLVTISTSALPVFEGIKDIRNRAINGLMTLFDSSSNEVEKREVVSALREAMQPPGRASYSNELLQLTLENTKKITEMLTQRATGQPYEVLEHIENEMLFDYRRARKIVADEQDKFGCQQIAENVMEAIIIFRDLINADQQYLRYKTLVGYSSVLPFQWENEAFNYSAANEYRTEQIALYVDEVSDETADDWYRLIRLCATKSNDRSNTFVFGEFLRQLSKVKPKFAFALAKRDDADVLTYLPAIFTGLFESEARDTYDEILEYYLDRSAHLTAITRHCHLVKKAAAGTIMKVLDKAIAVNEVIAVSECLIFAIENHDPQELPLVDNVFVPAIKYLISKRDAQWVSRTVYLPESEKFFHELSSENTDLVLENLLNLNRIDHDAESVLTPIAMQCPTSVWAFFERRVREKKDRKDHYQAIPYQLHELAQPLARDVDLAIATLRKWYRPGDPMFRYTGGLLLQAVFPTFTDELAKNLRQIVVRGSDEDYDFAIQLLENYHGEPPTHEVIKEIIDSLPENDPNLFRLDICLNNTGVVSGVFGMVEAYRKKKEEIALWQNDSRPKVREFAASYMRRMEQEIAGEQRSAEMRNELRKRDYEAEEVS